MKDSYETIEGMLKNGVYEGNRHNCIRDASRLAGGCVASGRLSQTDADALGVFALQLAGGGREFEREWVRGVQHGMAHPAERLPETLDARGDNEPDRPLGWDEPLSLAEAGTRLLPAAGWQGEEVVEDPDDEQWKPEEEALRWIRGLFRPGEYVGIVSEAIERDGKWTPANRGFKLEAGQLISDLEHGTELGFAMADYEPRAGMWARFNPLAEGRGVSDADVTDFRYALVECDEGSVGEQVAQIRALNLPCKFIVHSGGHSAHALVHIDAGSDAAEYRKRVEFLYKTCRERGLNADKTGNPSRLSRLPGATRNGRKQFIIAEDVGLSSWQAWIDFLERTADDLPAFQSAADQMSRLDDGKLQLRPEIIGGVLREGHKMRLTGPSKAGKSFALLELAVALTEGTAWLGRFPCPNPGNVLYVNMELDEASLAHRLKAIYAALGVRPKHAKSLYVWQMRGRATPLDKLAPIIIRRCRDMHLRAVIVDPIYKVLTGDENAAADMARFCNLFDRIAMECGCAVIDCHHHSKGAQAGKRSMDRASGSGVFARDPDALLDMIELDADNARRQAQRNAESEVLWRLLHDRCPKDAHTLAPDASPDEVFAVLDRAGLGDEARAARLPVVERWKGATAWRIEGTLREFPSFGPADCWFQYPAHAPDHEKLLADCRAKGDEQWQKKQQGDGKPGAGATVVNVLDELFQDGERESVDVKDVADEVAKRCRRGECSNKTVTDAVNNSKKYHHSKGVVYRGRAQQ